MERRRAVAIAAAVTASTLGAAAAIAVNLGLLGSRADESKPLGQLNAGQVAELVNPTDPSRTAPADSPPPKVTIRYEDVYLPAPAATPGGTGAPAAPQEPAQPGDHDGYDDPDDHDDRYDRDHDKHDRDHDDDHDRDHDDKHDRDHHEEDD